MSKITVRPQQTSTQSIRIKAVGPQGAQGDSGDASLTPEVSAALAGSDNPSGTNVFITQSSAIVWAIVLGG